MKNIMYLIILIFAFTFVSCQKTEYIYEHKIEVLDSLGNNVPYKYNFDTVYSHTAFYGSEVMELEDLKAIKSIYCDHQALMKADTIKTTFTGKVIAYN